MNPGVRKAMGSSAVALAVVAMAAGSYVAWRKYGGLNPYAGLGRKLPHDPTTEILVSGVQMKHYEGGKLTASAQADRMRVAAGANRLTLDHVKNGTLQTPQGPMQFAAGMGVLQPNLKTVDLSNGIRVKGRGGVDFDVQSERATLNGRIGEINVPTPLKGTIMGGQLTAASLVRRMGSGVDYARMTLPTWTGSLPRTAGMPKEMQSDKVWHFTGDETTVGSEDPKVTDPALKRLRHAVNGWASDGEMVITAPFLTEDPKTEIVTATSGGGVRATYHSAKADIVADKVVIYQQEHKAFCTGHVLVYVRAKKEWDKPLQINDEDRGPLVPDIPPSMMAKMGQGSELSQAEKDKIQELRSGKNLRDYPMQMAAEEVTYWYKEGERHAIAKGGNPTAFQKFDDGRWRQAWAPEAHYDGEKDMLDLIGSMDKREVHMKNSVADNNDCYKAKLSTKEDQTEDDEYVYMYKPKGHGIDFDADKSGANAAASKSAPGAKPATNPPAVTPPTGTPPTKGTNGG